MELLNDKFDVKSISIEKVKEGVYCANFDSEQGGKLFIPMLQINFALKVESIDATYYGIPTNNKTTSVKLELTGDVLSDGEKYFEYTQPTFEMTLKEIEKQLGHKVKIVT